MKLGAIPNKLNQGFLIWHKTNHAIGAIACFVDAMLWGGNAKFGEVINELIQIFHVSLERKKIFE